MNEVITCTVLGIASIALGDVQTNPSGRETWTGVRLRTVDGKARFLKGMMVEPEAALIIREAMDQGERIEMWLTGKDACAYPYGLRTATEEWYHDGYSGYLTGQAIKFLIFGILTLPILGMGLLFMPLAVSYFFASSTFATRHSQATFKLGYEAGVLGRNVDAGPVEQRQAA